MKMTTSGTSKVLLLAIGLLLQLSTVSAARYQCESCQKKDATKTWTEPLGNMFDQYVCNDCSKSYQYVEHLYKDLTEAELIDLDPTRIKCEVCKIKNAHKKRQMRPLNSIIERECKEYLCT